MQKILLSILFILSLQTIAQNRLVFNNNFYTVITNSTTIVLENQNSNSVTNLGGSNIIGEGELNAIKWDINSQTGSYQVPFTTSALVKIPLEVTITTAGTGTNSSVLFSTFETLNDNNTNYPTDVTSMNADCGVGNGLNTIDRFWIIDANSYNTKPNATITFGYDDGAAEMGGTNTINVRDSDYAVLYITLPSGINDIEQFENSVINIQNPSYSVINIEFLVFDNPLELSLVNSSG